MADPREPLGRVVRETWVAWAREQPDPKPSWLTGWDDLGAGQREVDMRIGAAIAAGLGVDGTEISVLPSRDGTLRRCLIPGCPATFDTTRTHELQAQAARWLHCSAFRSDYLCPDHQHLWAGHAHEPLWLHAGDRLEVSGCGCNCEGWLWLPSEPIPPERYRARYARHLLQVIEREAADGPA